jgi:hypothetical protein
VTNPYRLYPNHIAFSFRGLLPKRKQHHPAHDHGGLRTILEVTRSTSRKNVAAKISEKNGPVLAIGITTETLPRSSA